MKDEITSIATGTGTTIYSVGINKVKRIEIKDNYPTRTVFSIYFETGGKQEISLSDYRITMRTVENEKIPKPFLYPKATRIEGRVNWWNHEKGIGFIEYQDDNENVKHAFVHYKSLIDDHSLVLNNGDAVTFALIDNLRTNKTAVDVVIHNSEYPIR